jgi:hypothetical protein
MPKTSEPCSIDGCDLGRGSSRGLCSKHYTRLKRHGDPLITKRYVSPRGVPIDDRFWAKVKKTETCWLWTGATAGGYGVFGSLPGSPLAHRFSYGLAYGEVASNVDLDHRCRVRSCVNPDHLRPASRKENMENVTARRSNRSSGVRGVTWDKFTNRWRAGVMHNYRFISAGRFDSIEEAEAAAIALRNRLFTHNEQDRVA